MHFLIVDDDRSVTKLMSAYLTKRGHVCTGITNSLEAVPWIKKNDCDAIILDIGMPNIDGIELIPKIREIARFIPIIIFTGMGYDGEKMKQALAAGANGFVSKGMPPDEVYLALQRTIAAVRK